MSKIAILYLYASYIKGWAFMITVWKCKVGISHIWCRIECIKQKKTKKSVPCDQPLYSCCPKVPGPNDGVDASISLVSVSLQSCARGRCGVEWSPETLWGLPFLPSISPAGHSNQMDVLIMRATRLSDGKVGWVGETICSLFLCYLSKAISTDSPAPRPPHI